MSLRTGASSESSELPVFLFPASLNFVAATPAGHKQILTLYNPYDFPIEYKVLSTAPAKYSVGDPAGILRPKCCIDIVIRHTGAARAREAGISAPQTDRFRVQIWERGNRSASGRKDVPSTLVARTTESADPSTSAFQGVSTASGERRSPGSQYAFSSRRQDSSSASEGSGLTPLTVVGGLVCVVALSLPSEGETSTSLPAYLHLTLPQKLVAAYVLGLVTMLLIRR